jgi:hypothetical protein
MAIVVQIYATFFISIFSMGFILALIQNNVFKTRLEKFMWQTENLENTVLKDLKIRQTAKNIKGFGSEYLYLGSLADINVFDNFIVLFRRQKFIINVNFNPIIIAKDAISIKKQYTFGEIYKPQKVFFRTTVKGELTITLMDKQFKNREILINLKKLNSEQVEQLSKLKQWCE